jgi:DNA end-binding protein Ku
MFRRSGGGTLFALSILPLLLLDLEIFNMARALWKGAINFGLVHIPVSLWKATRPQDLHFRMLHEKDLEPLKQKKVCSVENVEVKPDEIVKGYEIRKGEFIKVEPEELEALEPENSHSIDIEDFVDIADVDPIYYETAYYLAPERGAAKPYGLLVAAMQESGKAAIARFVLRTKQHLVLMRPFEHGISMSTLFYADEVMSIEEVPGIPKEANPSRQELEMAIRLIESMSNQFDPEQYEDTYRERVVEMLKQKAKGKAITAPKQKEEPARVIDLVSALQASLGERGSGDKAASKKTAKKPASKPAAKKGKSGKKKSAA